MIVNLTENKTKNTSLILFIWKTGFRLKNIKNVYNTYMYSVHTIYNRYVYNICTMFIQFIIDTYIIL